MVLSDNDIRELIKNPKNKSLLNQGIEHENRINALCNGTNSDFILSEYAAMHVEGIKGVIMSKFNMHGQSWLSLGTGTVFTHYQKIFDTADGEEKHYHFSDTNEMIDFFEYLDTVYGNFCNGQNGQKDFYRNLVLSDILYNPNTKYVVDFKENQDANSPIILRIPLKKIHDYEEINGRVVYLITKHFYNEKNVEVEQNKAKYIIYRIYTETDYRVYKQEYSSLTLISESEHKFSYCPVWSASNYNFSASNYILKKSPISDSIADIYNWTLIKNISKYYNWQKGSPPSTGIIASCKYANVEHENYGSMCTNGFFYVDKNEIDSNGKKRFTIHTCPDCEKKKKEKFQLGKQTDIFYEDIFHKNGAKPELLKVVRDSLGHIETNTKYLEVITSWLANEESRIKGHIIGEGFNQAQSKEAFNKDYINVSTDDKQNNLGSFAAAMEILQSALEIAIAEGRYFSFQGLYINYGREYFLKDSSEIQKEILDLCEKGGDVFLLLQKMNTHQKSKRKGDIVMQTLGEITLAVIPYTDMPIAKVIEQKDKLVTNKLTELQYLIRVNSITFLQKFILLEKNRLFANGGLRTLYKRFSNFMYSEAQILQENKIDNFIKLD